MTAIACRQTHAKRGHQVYAQQKQLGSQQPREVLSYQLWVLCNVACVVVGQSYVEQDIKYVAEIEQCEIEPVGFVAHGILHTHLDPQQP